MVLGDSGRAPFGTVGIYLRDDRARGPANAFMLSTEFAHAHPVPDHSLHLTLPEPLCSEAIAAGWTEPHPLAGYPTVSALIVLLYAPRDAEELTVACDLVTASWAYASGHKAVQQKQEW
ncbi:luciferase family protein [Paralcaligenes ureilyticus]|uniref:luciferase domain-containing protein n=1 Tax=Paralcaligenes ureilyticus TaxID=627131 RepID=UPI00313352DE